MKILLKISILIVVMNFSALLFAQDLEEWIGDKALNRIHGKTFFDKADELLSLKKDIPSEAHSYLTGSYFVYSLVEQIDSFLVTHRCRPHCCPCENLWLAIKLNSNQYICVYHNIVDTINVVHCYGRGLYIAQLPDTLKDGLILDLALDYLHNDDNSAGQVYHRNSWIDTIRTESSAMPPNQQLKLTK
jgi:hypothetical protein